GQFVRLVGGVMTPPYGWCKRKRSFICGISVRLNRYRFSLHPPVRHGTFQLTQFPGVDMIDKMIFSR
ncbi:MAG: hypothetical protein ACI4PH_10745, partial [Faecousia sp.]